MKKALPLIIIVLVLSVGVAGYFVWKHLSEKDEATPTPPITPVTSNPTTLGTSPGTESAPEIFIRKPLWIEPIPQPVETVPVPLLVSATMPARPNMVSAIKNHNTL